MKLEGHIKVLGGPYVARGPDVAQACYIDLLDIAKIIKKKMFYS